MSNPIPPDVLSRAQGCLLGQFAGDSLGSLVEFESPAQILRRYPNRVRDLADGGTWNTIAGQPTDDSEMALALARALVAEGRFTVDSARAAYLDWLHSRPFDVGNTIGGSLRGRVNPDSQANGALMRISPLGIFGTFRDSAHVAEWARQDGAITHVNEVCLQVNALFACAISSAIRTGPDAASLFAQIGGWAKEWSIDPLILDSIDAASDAAPPDLTQHRGWVIAAFGNALWQLVHTESLEEAMIDTVMRGGDTDTNAAICGALLGAVYGRAAVPERWVTVVLNCRPEHGKPGVRQPRPEHYWPVDALELAEQLLIAGREMNIN